MKLFSLLALLFIVHCIYGQEKIDSFSLLEIKDTILVSNKLQGKWELKKVRDNKHRKIEFLNELLPNGDDHIIMELFYNQKNYYTFMNKKIVREFLILPGFYDKENYSYFFQKGKMYIKKEGNEFLPQIFYLYKLKRKKLILYQPLYHRNLENVKYLLLYYKKLK